MSRFKSMLRPSAVATALCAVNLATVPLAHACSSCGCMLGTDFAGESFSSASRGLKLDFRFDLIDQNQLRNGRGPVDRGALTFPNEAEIQQGTLSRFYSLGADYSFNRDWGLNVSIPFIDREHETITEGDTEVSTSHTRNLGDLRILGRYQGFFADKSWGVQFGLKLPTGAHQERFESGPQVGEIVDRGLQAGTGTTDLIAGVYNNGGFGSDAPLANFDRFEQVQIKQALDSREQFRPSTQVSLNAGIRYVGNRFVTPQLQINGKWEGRELGAEADYDNSGSKVLAVSPGVTVKIGAPLSAYGFVQVPVYQDYTGYQLAPRYTVSLGLRYSL